MNAAKSYLQKAGTALMLSAGMTVGLGACTAKEETSAQLTWDASRGAKATLTMPTGETVSYTAYTKIYYVSNVEDTTYQYLNVFVPDGATQQSPIFMKTNVGGYMASEAGQPQAGQADGRALKEGYVVVLAGSRGRNSQQGKLWTGKAPNGILDLKAAIRYLRHVDRDMPGDAEKIVTDGTSAGGAMSALMGATGNNPAYEPYLEKMGAAKERDDVYASVVFCPITDLQHADIAYEWLFQNTDSRKAMDSAHQEVTRQLAALFPQYIAELRLHLDDGTPLTASNYRDFIKREIIRAAQIAKNAGADIPDSLGFTFSSDRPTFAPVNGGAGKGKPAAMPMGAKGMKAPMAKPKGEYITGLDLDKYLNYVAAKTPLKTAPAFDSYLVAGNEASGENDEFADCKTDKPANFTEFAAKYNKTTLSSFAREAGYLLNPMPQIGQKGVTTAQHWYIRHGSIDRDTAFPIMLNLATKLKNEGKDVNYLLAWNRPHSGDYSLDEVFAWLAGIMK